MDTCLYALMAHASPGTFTCDRKSPHLGWRHLILNHRRPGLRAQRLRLWDEVFLVEGEGRANGPRRAISEKRMILSLP